MAYLFEREEIPYTRLQECGVNREMFDDFPEEVIEGLLKGKLSPVIPLLIKGENEKQWKCAKFRFDRADDNTVGLIIFPQFETTKLEEFTEQEQEWLLEGKTILHKKNEDIMYAQFDEDVNQVISVVKDTIGINVTSYGTSYGLKDEEIIQMLNINIVEIEIDGKLMALGIDLTEPTGVRIVEGNTVDWLYEKNKKLPTYSFGLFGCWVNNGNALQYVAEENYTQDMWNEMERIGAQNAAKKHMGR